MTNDEIATADIETINRRQDELHEIPGHDRERSELESRREQLAAEHYGPPPAPFDRPIAEIIRRERRKGR
jgi:hypothetical protein